ncbi:hypothetical protein L7F22_027741 [Adiantum nelumboides]|nr:hypothetical protein [Adiantum nelumboides]
MADEDVAMGEASSSDGATTSSCSKRPHNSKRFEIRKWNVVALSAWDIVVDNCAICRNHIMDLCIECQANQALQARTVQFHGVYAIMLSIFTASAGG